MPSTRRWQRASAKARSSCTAGGDRGIGRSVDEVLRPFPAPLARRRGRGGIRAQAEATAGTRRELEACAEPAPSYRCQGRSTSSTSRPSLLSSWSACLGGRPSNLGALPPGEGRRRGLACGRLHAALAEAVAAGGVPLATNLVTTTGADTPPKGDRLLHLDLHPFNVLVDDGGEVSGVVDWANASAGHPDLDRARSASIFSYIRRLWRDQQTQLGPPSLRAGNRRELSDLAASALVWAYRYMLADLSHRYRKDELSPLRTALDKLTMS